MYIIFGLNVFYVCLSKIYRLHHFWCFGQFQCGMLACLPASKMSKLNNPNRPYSICLQLVSFFYIVLTVMSSSSNDNNSIFLFVLIWPTSEHWQKLEMVGEIESKNRAIFNFLINFIEFPQFFHFIDGPTGILYGKFRRHYQQN